MKLILFLFLIFFSVISAQNSRDTEALFLEARNLLYQKPSESAVISEFLAKNSTDRNDQVKALLLLAESSLIRGDYNHAGDQLFQCLKMAEQSLSPDNERQINFLLARLCDELGIRLSQLYLIKDEKDISQNYYEKAISAYSQNQWRTSIRNLKLSEHQTSPYFPDLRNFYYALAYSHLGKPDSARYYSKKIQLHTPYELYAKAKIQSSQNDPDKSIDHLELLKPVENNVQDVWLRDEIYQLGLNNAESKSKEKYREFYQLHTALQDSLSTVKENARIAFLTKIGQKQDEILEARSQQQKRMLYYIVTAILMVLIIGSVINRKLKERQHAYEKAAKEAEEREKFIIENKAPESAGKIVIPDKTIGSLLKKLETFETNNGYLDPAISLNLLSENLNTNTKYLSEIINTYKHKNFHSYINELRINYIIRKIRANPVYLKYKVSHLAEEAGFSSHSLFSTVFKQVTGDSPATFIKNIKNQ